MVISMLPMTAFGQISGYRPDMPEGTSFLIEATFTLTEAELDDIAGLLAATPTPYTEHLRLTLSAGATFGTPVSGAVPAVPATLTLNGIVIPAANAIHNAAHDEIIINLTGITLPTVVDPALASFVLAIDGIVGTGDPATLGGAALEIEIMEWDDTATPQAVGFDDLDTPFNETIVPLVGATSSLTIAPGVVRNPEQIAHTVPRSFDITMDMSRLHTVQTLANSAQLLFTLSEQYVRFSPLFPIPADEDGGTPIIRVHPDSQLFYAGNPGVLIPNPASLFTGTGNPGSDAQKGQLHVLPVTTPWQELTAFLTLSDEGVAVVGGIDIHRLSGTLVLTIEGIRPHTAGGRITVRRIGGQEQFAVQDTLVNNQLLVQGAANWGVNFNGASARYFTSGLWLPEITITERRPMSFHQSWAYGANQNGTQQSGQVIHYIRLLGPRDYVWNVDAVGGVQPLDAFEVYDRRGTFGAAGVMTNPIFEVIGQHIDGRTGRPALMLRMTVPAISQRSGVMQQVAAEFGLRNLSLFPTRDDVPRGNVNVDIEFGLPGGLASTALAPIWIPQPTTGTVTAVVTYAEYNAAVDAGIINALVPAPVAADFPASIVGPANITNPQITAALIQLGRGYLAPQSIQANARADRLPHPQPGEIAQAITNAGATLPMLTPWQLAGLSWFPQGGGFVTAETTWARRGDNWSGSKTVGYRTIAALELRTWEADNDEDLPVIVSGQRNFPEVGWERQGAHPWTNNAHNNAVEGSRTARVQLVELVPGALELGWNAAVVEFTLPDEVRDGAQLMHAAWRVTQYGQTNAEVGWHHVDLLDQDVLPPVTALGIGALTRDRFRLTLPRNPHPNRLRTVEVVFFVSTVAGYEVLIGEDLVVVATGNATGNLAPDNREVTIAHVADPIVVSLDGDRVQIDVGQVMTPTSLTPIPNITIEETAAGRLTRGTIFTIGVEALPIPVFGNHALVDTVVVHDNSGLEVRATRVGTGQTAYMRFEVIRESINGPGKLVLSNNYVIGTFLPGIVYGVSVNGTPTAAWPTPANISQNPIAQNTARGLSGPGNFDVVPYFIDFIEFGEFDYEGLPPGVGDDSGTPGLPNVDLRLWAGMPAWYAESQRVATPFMWRYLPQYGLRVAMVNPRVFADRFGLNLTWDEGAGAWTITGNGITVVGTVNSPNAVINGETIDIASFISYASGPAGSVYPMIVEERSFLPVRFFANVFGLDISLENNGNTVVVH